MEKKAKLRETEILRILSEEGRKEVSLLADKLGVSQVTIRKDLDELEKKGIIRREHGSAVLSSSDDISGRIAVHYEEKLAIARTAAELVHDGDTVMIESGSCCALLANELAETKHDITIITNSAFIASYIRSSNDVHVILLGGIYQPDAQIMVGPLVRQCVENFMVNYFFCGTDGYVSGIGFTNKDQMRAQAVRDMASQASQAVILTESEKFSTRGVVPLTFKNKLKIVVTDVSVPDASRQELEENGIELLVS